MNALESGYSRVVTAEMVSGGGTVARGLHSNPCRKAYESGNQCDLSDLSSSVDRSAFRVSRPGLGRCARFVRAPCGVLFI